MIQKRLRTRPNLIDFREQPTVSDFSYHFVVPPKGRFNDYVESRIFKPAFDEVRDLYGIVPQRLSWGELSRLGRSVSFVLIGPINPLGLNQQEQEYLKRLGQIPNARINVVSAYSDNYDMKQGSEIRDLDRRLNLHTIYPSELDRERGIRTVSARYAADSMVCERRSV